ncbi:MAG: RluA family pseudouridine synthase [Treponema sp.]|jgi:23S rRNA pseudouridine955/2504/2580 synthase|nr:RluA family pseudouridine synthase [Treponema sp.]
MAGRTPLILTAGRDDADRRLDRVLRRALPSLPLSALHRLLRGGSVLVDGKAAAGEDRVGEGAVITVNGLSGDEPARAADPKAHIVNAAAAARRTSGAEGGLDILWRGDGLLVINKPAGLAVHGGQADRGLCLDAMVRGYLAGELPPSLSFSPGPLHRLDRPTSGIIVFSSDLSGARFFSAMLQGGRVQKQYLAITDGTVEEAETWEDELVRDTSLRKTLKTAPGAAGTDGEKGRAALTKVRPLASGPARAGLAHTLILAETVTGRTHQIRAQAAVRGHPLSGDKKYGGGQGGAFFLHAWKIEIPRPDGGDPLRVTAPLPPRFARKIAELFPGQSGLPGPAG